MKQILFALLVLIFTLAPARAQDAATQQQLDKMFGQLQDMQAAQELQAKRLDALAKQISDLSDKVNTPAASTGASADDLKSLATQVQEIDKKRQADRELILKQIENLGKVAGTAPVLADPGGEAPGVDRPAIAVGPEGGWDDDERAVVTRSVGLGPTVLRAETAAVVAGALLCALRCSVVLPLA